MRQVQLCRRRAAERRRRFLEEAHSQILLSDVCAVFGGGEFMRSGKRASLCPVGTLE